MMDNNSLEYWFANLQNERPYLDEATLIKLVESRVTELLDTQPDLLWSYLYRLDVEEHKIELALLQGTSVAHALAILIIDRQKQRVKTKRAYREGADPGQDFNPTDL
ncbi:MAG: hypothetical protein KA109_14375 [Saprospiraceae bacterium]|jgi:CHAD domain-containing protein|nr:hypothetical protein [Saprospiraceae bacterium]MBK6479340.1 hypothetical protein [Saprospiraceae bacterium]MBK6817530.1 hypothetical protein [Saprospiraceae bacterium]MBK7372922.1 hypothetical protein [Saprospiraceae bacterium]MBK7439593.1 hypothetical protein [Saprospiraceae bacterium]